MLRRSTYHLQQPAIGFLAARKAKEADLAKIAEIRQANKFLEELRTNNLDGFTVSGASVGSTTGVAPKPLAELDHHYYHSSGATASQHQSKTLHHVVEAAFATFTLHVESRVANALGKGFYTIGPCGEELLAPIGVVLRNSDPCALHYRHLAPSISRRLANPNAASSLSDVLFDRAKGYVVASTDPVCGGHHCCLGGSSDNDFLVTSTLASQSCPALGRAMGIPLSNKLLPSSPTDQDKNKNKNNNSNNKFPNDAVSFVTLGDGSINNAHFLSAINLADYALHRNYKIPVVFCITDNNICISLRGNKFVDRFLNTSARFKTHSANGSDVVDTWNATHKAVAAARKTGRPQLLVLRDITRRFGHAATDRQSAYMSSAEISAWENRNPLVGFARVLTDAGAYTHTELAELFEATWEASKEAFELADKEPKISTRAQVATWNSAPIIDLQQKPNFFKATNKTTNGSENNDDKNDDKKQQDHVLIGETGTRGAKTHLMRKHMNSVLDELLSDERGDVVYIGEDVTHGGYYLVTDGLHKKHPLRVLDFPPDETSLIGAGLGFSQSGLVPIVEIPYAKYLDCGFDAFTETVVMHWLSRGREANGVLFRLQGFGRGVFGGNYHTHNMIHIPPGLDVVCCARGDEYAKTMRYAMEQVRAGRCVMFVDSTELLNLRDVKPNGGPCWEFPYAAKGEYMTFDDVTVYRFSSSSSEKKNNDDNDNDDASSSSSSSSHKKKKIAVVTYGNGLLSALEADLHLNAKLLSRDAGCGGGLDVDIIDCRLLSDVPRGLKDVLMKCSDDDDDAGYDAILFADPCKFGTHPLQLHFSKFVNWSVDKNETTSLPTGKIKTIGAEFTYNPLGNKLTFLSAADIVDALYPML